MISASVAAGQLPNSILVSRHLHLPPRNPNFCFPSTSSSSQFIWKPLGSDARSSSLGPPLLSTNSSSETALPPPEQEEEASELELGQNGESDNDDGVEVEVAKVGRNRRRVQARIAVDATLDAVWKVLTDYEGLADFIPGLAICQLLEKGEGFARLYQVGQQDLALGLKFEAKATLDCLEKDLEILPSGRRREIEFKMIDGDFKKFHGVWSILQTDGGDDGEENCGGGDPLTFLFYTVELEPKLLLPVRLLEGRICREVKVNLQCIRDRAQMLLGPSTLALRRRREREREKLKSAARHMVGLPLETTDNKQRAVSGLLTPSTHFTSLSLSHQ